MDKIKVKAFVTALNLFHDDQYEMRKYFKDNRLTQTEKKILKCWLLFKDSKYEEVVNSLNNLDTTYDEVVEAQKNLLLGMTFNNKCQFKNAVEYIERSLPILKKYQIAAMEFTALYNLFITYSNLKLKDEMTDTLNSMKQIPHLNERYKALFYNCELQCFLVLDNVIGAKKTITTLNKMIHEMNPPLFMSFLIGKFCFFIKTKEYDQCEDILSELKNKKSFSISSNFKYMRLMLKHLILNEPLYVYDYDFADSPFLFNQIKVIENLEKGNTLGAKNHWNYLQREFPHIYKNDFHYSGDISLFSKCLEKYRSMFSTNQNHISLNLDGMKKEEALLKILNSMYLPIEKEALYEMLWKTQALEKNDFQKLQKLVSRLRDRGINICFKKNCYSLTKKVA